jgi:hypothetical protein
MAVPWRTTRFGEHIGAWRTVPQDQSPPSDGCDRRHLTAAMAAIYTISRDGYVCVSVRLGYYWRFYGAVLFNTSHIGPYGAPRRMVAKLAVKTDLLEKVQRAGQLGLLR